MAANVGMSGVWPLMRKNEMAKSLTDWQMGHADMTPADEHGSMAMSSAGCPRGYTHPDMGYFDGNTGSPVQLCYCVWTGIVASLYLDDDVDAETVKRIIPAPNKLVPMLSDGGQETYQFGQGMYPGTRMWDGECYQSVGFWAAEAHLSVGNFDEALEHNDHQAKNYYNVTVTNRHQKGRILAARAKASLANTSLMGEATSAFERALREAEQVGSPLMIALVMKELKDICPKDKVGERTQYQSRYEESLFDLTMERDTELRRFLESD